MLGSRGLIDLGRLLIASLALSACNSRSDVGLWPLQLGDRDHFASGEAEPTLTRHPRKAKRQRANVRRRIQSVGESTAMGSDAFSNPEACQAALRRGERFKRAQGTARVAAWNVRWFPDGVPGNPSETTRATDVDWMACVLAWMQADVVALSEIKSRAYSEGALTRLTSQLDGLTSGRYKLRLDDCPDQNGQHVAFLVNEQRVAATDWQMHPSLNPNGDACAGQLRPGLGVKLRFPGGLDLHAIAVHLKSGVEPRDIGLRRKSIDALERIVASVTERSRDADLLVAGDFNTMGCRSCADMQRSAAEASWLDTRLKAFRPELARIPSDIGCSLYYQRQPTLLDHFVMTRATQELLPGTQAIVLGHCRELGCEGYSGKDPDSVSRLSDHCPILLSLLDQDLD